MQTLANEDQTSLSEEDGIRIVGTVHQKVTGKAWGRDTQKHAGHVSVEEEVEPLSDPDAMSLGGGPESINEWDVSIRRNYRFAVLERHHTTDFLGKSTDEPITLIKDSKPVDLNLPEDDGIEIDPRERETLQAIANKLTVPQLRTCLKDWGVGGLTAKRKSELVELILDRAKHLGLNEVVEWLEKTPKRAPSGSIDSQNPKKRKTNHE